jgi:superfamily II DNA or RNA helicase
MLRDFQQAAIDQVRSAWAGHQSTLLVMATGTGKTVTAASIVADRIGRCGRAMVVAHREELVEQAAATIKRIARCDVAVEMASRRSIEDGFSRCPVVVASVQTLTTKRGTRHRFERFRPSDFGTVWFDEAHHATAATWAKVWRWFSANEHARLLGTTATPDRADEQALGTIFSSVAYQYGMLEGIRDGWLVPVKQSVVHVSGLDFSGVRTTAGELNGADLAALMEYEQTLHRMVGPTIEIAGNRRTLLFCTTVDHAKRVAEIINRHHPGKAACIHAGTDRGERKNILRDFGAGQLQFLANVGITTEGWDDPATDGKGVQVVAMLRPTKSRSLYCQMAGRGTRPIPGCVDALRTPEARRAAIGASAKPSVLLLDFMGNCGRHRLIHAGDVLGGQWGEETRQRSTRRAAEAPSKEVDVLQMLDETERLLKDEQARKQRSLLKGKASYSTQVVDPFEFVGIAPPKVKGFRAKLPASDKQRAYLARNGVPNADRLTLDEASAIIDALMKRPTDAQAWFLRKHGRDPQAFDRKTASEEIGRIKEGAAA